MTNRYDSSSLFKHFFEAIFIILLASGHEAYGSVFNVCPKAKFSCKSIYTVNWPGLTVNDTVVINKGVYNQPILIFNVPAGTNIVSGTRGDVYINSYVFFINSNKVLWDGGNRTYIRNTSYPGIGIVQGSSNLTITRTEISETGLGIWISMSAGCGHDINGNNIFNNYTQGIGIDKVNCTAGNETIISDNNISGNLYHGVELNGNYYIIEHNEVARNGNGSKGTSGIHVYAASHSEGTGQYNIIRFNVSHDNSDIDGPDGNGIQLDQYTRFNVVSDNEVFNNNGSGIIVYDGSDAQIMNNTVYNNMIDALGSHKCCNANIVVTSAKIFDSTQINHIYNINVSNNTIIGYNQNTAPIYVDPLSAINNVTIENNIIQ